MVTAGDPPPEAGSEAPEPTVAFSPGQQPAAPTPSEQPQPSATAKRRKVVTIAGIGLLAVLLIGGGVAFAGLKLGWFGGGGRQPYQALPSSSIGYYQLDLNPTVDQKLAALSFFRELPQLKDVQANASLDVKELAWNEWAKSNDTNGLTYAADIKPWLGDRVGFALLAPASGATDPVAVAAVQVTDEKVAAEKIPTLLKNSGTLVSVSDGYAVIADSNNVDRVKSELAAGTLDKNQTFTSDLGTLGNTGWVAGWTDLKSLGDLARTTSSATPQLTGRSTFALRFSGNTLELAGDVLGVDSTALPTSAGGSDLNNLPADTGLALSVQGGGAWLKSNWNKVSEALSAISSSLTSAGWSVPDDLVSALGTQFTVAVPRSTLSTLIASWETDSADSSLPTLGVKVTTDKPQRVQELITLADTSSVTKVRVSGNTVSLATTSDYLSQLADNTGAKLSASAVFTSVVPEHSSSVFTLYFNTASLGEDWTSKLPSEVGLSEEANFLKTLTSAGFSVVPNSAGASWALRVARS